MAVERKEMVKLGKRIKLVEPIQDKELQQLSILPTKWRWARPESLCFPEPYSIGIGPFGSNLKVSDYRLTGVPLIFVKNITRNDFTLDLKFVDTAKYEELEAHSIKPLDIAITKMGDPPGDCAIYPENLPVGIITSDCLKFRIWDKYINRKYIKYCIETTLIKKQLGVITKGVAQKKISLERFKTLLFPIAPLQEQHQIVREIESRLSVCDKLEETISHSLKQAEALRQSILKQAFAGKLVPQDPQDEPAAALLARIRSDREATAPAKKAKATKGRKK